MTFEIHLRMMDWLWGTKPKENPVVERLRNGKSHEQRLEEQYLKANIEIASKQQEIDELSTEAKTDMRLGQKIKAAQKMTRVKALEAELAQDKAKMRNLELQKRQNDTADADLHQAVLLKEGATELENKANAFDQIDVEDAVDRISDASSRLNDNSRLLSSSMFNGAEELIDPDEVAETLAQMEAEMADERLAALMLETPNGGVAVVATPPSKTPIQKPAV